jgi:hypothetical protein
MVISPIYLALTGFAWGVAGIYLLWGLWRAKSWAPRLMQAMALTYALYYWLNQIFVMEHPVHGAPSGVRIILPGNWQFAAGVTVVSLAYIAWVMNRSMVKRYYGVPDDQVKPVQDAGGEQE